MLEQFWSLEGHRQFGAFGGVGPCPVEAMEQRLDRLGILSADDRAEWLHYWTAMEAQYLKHSAAKAKTKEQAGGKSPAGRRPPAGHEEYGGGAEWDL